MPQSELGQYTGRLVFEPLPDGRRMRVLEHFGFMEPDGLHWPVPPSTIVDGASIPKALWSLVGGPFEGKYRDASVVHDYYCDVRSADWRSVHLVFYRGMLASGVSVRRAKIMYAAVYFAGPRWGETVVENVRQGPPAIPTRAQNNILFSVQHDPLLLALCRTIEREGKSPVEWMVDLFPVVDPTSKTILQLDKISQIIEHQDPSLRSLEAALDGALALIPKSGGASREIAVRGLADMRDAEQ